MAGSQSTSSNFVTTTASSGSDADRAVSNNEGSCVTGDSTVLSSPHLATDPTCGGLSDLRTVLDCGVIPVVSVLGIVGNVLCMVVFLRQKYRTVAKPLLLAFCAADILFLLATVLLSLHCIVSKVDREDGRVLHYYMLPQVDVFCDVMNRITLMLTLAIGAERCVAVTRPLKLRGVCSIPRTRTAVLIIFLAVFAFQAPAFFIYDVKRHVTGNVTTVELHKTGFYRDNSRFIDFYLDYCLLVILQGLPLVSIAVCFVIVLVSLKRRLQCAYPKTIAQFGAFARARGKEQERYTEKEHADLVLEERKMTRALLAILLLCLVTELPYLVTEVIRVTCADIQSSSFLVARDVSRFLCVFNSAINFIVFMGLYKHFSVTFRKLAGLCN